MNIKDIANVIIKIESTLNNTPSVEVTAPPEPETRGFMAVDLTGASGVYLTLSRNETDFTTFNLTDPSFSPPEFGAWIGIGQNQNSGAFFDYPAILGDDAVLSDVQGISGMTLEGNVITPRHGAGGYVYPSDSVAFGDVIVNKPFNITPERNTVTAKATPDVPAGQDIFYSLEGAVDGGTVTIVSHAVIQFASASPINFLKFNNDIIEKNTSTQNHVLVYSINGGLPQAFSSYDGYGSTSATLSAFLGGNMNDVPFSYSDYADSGVTPYPPLALPVQLDSAAFYLYGFDATYFRVSREINGYEELFIEEDLSYAVVGEVEVTYYPASKLSASVDVDIFDLIIDPATYSAGEVQYFASHGITPATKNADGSYTIKSQLTIPTIDFVPPVQ